MMSYNNNEPDLIFSSIQFTLFVRINFKKRAIKEVCSDSAFLRQHFLYRNDSRRQSYQTFFLWKRRIFPFFATKLGCFTVNTFFHMLQTLKLNRENRNTGKMKVWQDRLLNEALNSSESSRRVCAKRAIGIQLKQQNLDVSSLLYLILILFPMEWK